MSERVLSTAVENFIAQRVADVDAALDEGTEPERPASESPLGWRNELLRIMLDHEEGPTR